MLKAILCTPEPILENSTDDRWQLFKVVLFAQFEQSILLVQNNFYTFKMFILQNCLGDLDGTFIRVNVPDIDKRRYRTTNMEIATNVLGVCSIDMKFIYVLQGWEGSAVDYRILRDAVMRRNGLKVPTGNYKQVLHIY